MSTQVGIGQSARRFLSEDSAKPCIIGGVIFEDVPGLAAESDGDVVYHAICSAMSTLIGIDILGDIAQVLCDNNGITDSQVYLEEALKLCGKKKVTHISVSLEAKRPLMKEYLDSMELNISQVLKLDPEQVGITVISGEGLSDYGCGEGIKATAIVTTCEGK